MRNNIIASDNVVTLTPPHCNVLILNNLGF